LRLSFATKNVSSEREIFLLTKMQALRRVTVNGERNNCALTFHFKQELGLISV